MANLACRCGAVISDGSDNLPYKANFFPDRAFGELYDWLNDELTSYAAAVEAGRREDWVRARSSDPKFHLGLPETDLLNDLIVAQLMIRSRTSYECERCGRLWVESQGDKFDCYLPESGRPNGPFRT